MAQRVVNTLQAVEGADGGQHRGRIGALVAACPQQAGCAKLGQKRVEQQGFGLGGEQARAEFTEDRAVKAGIGEGQRQQILPVDVTADGISGLFIGEALGELEDGNDGQAGRIDGGATDVGKERGEIGVIKERTEGIAQPQIAVTVRKGGVGDLFGIVGNKGDQGGIQGHGAPPGGNKHTILPTGCAPMIRQIATGCKQFSAHTGAE